MAERYGITVQISFSTKCIRNFKRIREERDSDADMDAYGVTLDIELFFPQNILESYGIKELNADVRRERFARYIRYYAEKCVPINAMRAPRLKWNTKRTDLNGLMLQIGKDCIEECAGADCRYIIIQPLFSGIPKADIWKENHKYYDTLGHLAKNAGVRILMENQCGYINGHFVRGVCADASVASEWIDTLNEELGEEIFGFCLDTGACHLCGQDMGEMVSILGERVNAIFVRECDGIHEASRLPFTGNNKTGQDTDWKGLIGGLRRIKFDGILMMDASDTIQGFSYMIRSHVYLLMRSVADYLKWQIGMEKCIKEYPARVLFGAGNMCRQYMMCYGEQYPPLFACDNNPELWGKSIYGLEVKSPEVLKELPEECVVIICNTFYEEIAKQLKDLGVKHIGTFSDDYLFFKIC